jgi:hypothetical protein
VIAWVQVTGGGSSRLRAIVMVIPKRWSERWNDVRG